MQFTRHGPRGGPGASQDRRADRRERDADQREQIADHRERIADQREQIANQRERDDDQRESGLDDLARAHSLAAPDMEARVRETLTRSQARIAKSKEAI